jgi:hypothetical protein
VITILSSPKPFVGNDKTNQYKAINSWKKIDNAEIFLFGDEEGIDEAGRELNVRVFKNIIKSKSGMPLFSSIISLANVAGSNLIQMYINCDIIINDTIISALRAITLNKFLLVGERIDLGEGINVDLSTVDYKKKLLQLYREKKIDFHGPTGVDYFIFQKGLWESLPEIIIGRGGYDSALIAHCKREEIPLIDGTGIIIALHQFHNYNHIKGGLKTVFYGEDAMINNRAQGGKYGGNWVSDSDFYIDKDRLKVWKCRGDVLRFVELYFRYNLNFNFGAFIIRVLRRMIKMGPLIPPNVNYRILNSLNADE